MLERRGVALTADERRRIESCTDLATLERWLDRAIEITAASQLFDG